MWCHLAGWFTKGKWGIDAHSVATETPTAGSCYIFEFWEILGSALYMVGPKEVN